jgi:3-hydroxyisobutyrate dehydrogenase
MAHYKKGAKMKVTFIGLGIMGSRMAKNLLKNNVTLTVFNRSINPMEELEKFGASAARSYREAVQDADIVFTMLSSPEVVEQVVFSDSSSTVILLQTLGKPYFTGGKSRNW